MVLCFGATIGTGPPGIGVRFSLEQRLVNRLIVAVGSQHDFLVFVLLSHIFLLLENLFEISALVTVDKSDELAHDDVAYRKRQEREQRARLETVNEVCHEVYFVNAD